MRKLPLTLNFNQEVGTCEFLDYAGWVPFPCAVKVVGSFTAPSFDEPGYPPYTGGEMERLEVTLPSGEVVHAYSRGCLAGCTICESAPEVQNV